VVEHFVGRDADLSALETALGRGHQVVITQSLTGLGGVGKSQLAAAYVARHAQDYDIVAWIRATGASPTCRSWLSSWICPSRA